MGFHYLRKVMIDPFEVEIDRDIDDSIDQMEDEFGWI